jgi:uncharacterized protein (DUF2384 family)
MAFQIRLAPRCSPRWFILVGNARRQFSSCGKLFSMARAHPLMAPSSGWSDECGVLTRATLRAAAAWGLSRNELGAIVGLSAASIARLESGKRWLAKGTKTFEFAALFVRSYAAVGVFCASSEALCRAWPRQGNPGLQGAVPLDLMKTVSGLVLVCNLMESRSTSA